MTKAETEYAEIAASLAKMITEYVDGANPDLGMDWRLGLPVIIEARLKRLLNASTLLASEERLTRELAEAKKRLEELGDF